MYSTTTFPFNGPTFYWRMRLWDQYGAVGPWSTTTASFGMIMTNPVSPSVLQDLSYTYDKLGNIVSIVDQSATQSYGTSTYQYDGLSRLVSATGTTPFLGNYTQSYVYDWLGNITNKSDQGAYTYAQTGYTNPHAATQIGLQKYTYDNSGNLLTSGNGSATSTYTWDYRGRLIGTHNSLGGATTTAYTYDTNDQRTQMVTKKGAAASTTQTYWNQFYETSSTGTTTMYIYAGGQLVATIEGKGSGTTTAFTHTDHLGSVAVQSSATGTLLQSQSYFPFGDTRATQQSTTFGQQHGYLSQFTDTNTSLNYLNSRYQSGAQGRFVSQDSVFTGNPNTQNLGNPQSLNAYNYAENNPVVKSDPNGKCVGPLAAVCIFAARGIIANAIMNVGAQYFTDVYNNTQNLDNGTYNGSVLAPTSDAGTYGQAVAGSILPGAAGGAGSLVGKATKMGQVVGGAIGTGVGAGADQFRQGSSVSDAVIGGTIQGGATFVGGKVVGGVPGRQPNLFTPNFFTGANMRNEVASNAFSGALTIPTQGQQFQTQLNNLQFQMNSIAAQVQQLQSQQKSSGIMYVNGGAKK